MCFYDVRLINKNIQKYRYSLEISQTNMHMIYRQLRLQISYSFNGINHRIAVINHDYSSLFIYFCFFTSCLRSQPNPAGAEASIHKMAEIVQLDDTLIQKNNNNNLNYMH